MAAVSSFVIGGLIVGGALYQGERQASAQRRALREQSKAQDFAMAQSIRQERANTEAIARANRRTPDIGALLAGQLAAAAAGGNAATQLARRGLGAPAQLDPMQQSPSLGTLLGT